MRFAFCFLLVLGTANLLPAETVQGIVTDPDGVPLEGVEVYLQVNTPGRNNVAMSVTSAEGAFQLPDPSTHAPFYWQSTVLAYKPGWAIGGFWIHQADHLSGPVQLTMRRPQDVIVQVVDPEGAPMADVPVELEAVQIDNVYLAASDVLAERTRLQADAEGKVIIDVLPPDVSFRIRVLSAQFGQQTFWVVQREGHATLQLRQTGRLVGRLVSDDSEVAANVPIDVRSIQRDPSIPHRPSGVARIETDREGNFEVPALASGEVRLTVDLDLDQPFRVIEETTANLAPGEMLEIEIPLVRGIPVRGSVVDRDTNEPVAGARLQVSSNLSPHSVTTNAEGDYASYGMPGRLQVRLTDVPAPYLMPVEGYQIVNVEPEAETYTIEPYRLATGRSLPGTVVDEQGRPVAGARVAATWRQREGSMSTIRSADAVSDQNGQFMLDRVIRDEELRLTASTLDRAMLEPLTLVPGESEMLSLQLAPEGVVTLRGQVVDASGEPVSGARVTLVTGLLSPSGQVSGSLPLRFNGRNDLTTGPDGWFETPHPIPRFHQYSLRAEAEGFLAFHLEKLDIDSGVESSDLPRISMQHVRTIEGVVVDTRGDPIEDAGVFALSVDRNRGLVRSQTETSGRFQLENVHPETPFVFAEKKGYRFSGRTLEDAGELQIVLRKLDEPIPGDERLTVKEPADPHRQQLLRELLGELFENGKRLNELYWCAEALKRLAPHDPEFVVTHLDAVTATHRRIPILLALGQVDDVLAVAETVESSYSRTLNYLQAADAVADAARKGEILADAYVHAQTEQDPARRVLLMALIADKLTSLGHADSAENILLENLPTARELAGTEWSGFARATFAEILGLIDLDAALELMPGRDEAERAHGRHHGNLAHRLAGIDPERAERVLSLLQGDQESNRYAIRVCYRMATVDLERARGIAERISQRAEMAHAHGVMARALVDKDPESARQLLRRAFELLNNDDFPQDRSTSLFSTGATLLFYSESVDPESHEEYLWRTLSLHPGSESQYFSIHDRQTRQDSQLSQLLVLLSLYEEFSEVRHRLMSPIVERHSTPGQLIPRYETEAIFAAMALVAPERTTRLAIDYLRDPPEDGRTLIMPEPLWTTAATLLNESGDDLRNGLQRYLGHTWVIDTVDY